MSYLATSRDGTRIAYDKTGHGPPVIIIGGAFQYRMVAPELALLAQGLAARGLTAVSFDRRGRGESTDEAVYTVEREVEDLAALIADLGGTAGLFGHSSGGVLGLFAAAADIGVSKLAMFEPPILPGDSRKEAIEQLQARLDANDREGAIAYFMKDMPSEWLMAAQLGAQWPSMQAVAHTLIYEETLVGALQTRPLTESLAPITQPVLLMMGEVTLPFVQVGSEVLKEALPHAEVHVIAGRDHTWSPEGMAIRLSEFFRG